MPVADHFMAVVSDPPATVAKSKTRNACEKCGQRLPDKTALWRHVQHDHGTDPDLMCPEHGCGKLFTSGALRRGHMAHHAMCGARPNTCEMCGMLLASRKTFYNHVVTVHKDCIRDLCAFCLRFSESAAALKAHVWQTHGKLMSSGIRCDVCGKAYCNRTMMLKHKAIHEMKK
ncbi:zinc finger protein 729-like [Adelges cooleyi]|uniref:zinc finger protein 729-like n=1 Tax=Adelges cooleyi TaxID=133065 RepID=UPI002180747B|nr:zinc finger protein 729-like [Adelges cooleyi]